MDLTSWLEWMSNGCGEGVPSHLACALVNILMTYSIETTGDVQLLAAHATLNIDLLDVIAFRLV